MKFKAPEGETIRVADLLGNAAVITDEPRELPEKLQKAALGAGAIPVYDKGEEPKAGADVLLPPSDNNDRHSVIVKACKDLLEKGNDDDFTATGSPSTEALSKALGWTVTAAERNAAWEQVEAEAAV